MFTIAPIIRTRSGISPEQRNEETGDQRTGDDIEHVAVVHGRRHLRVVLALDERLEHADRRAVDVAGQEADPGARPLRIDLQLLDEPVALLLHAFPNQQKKQKEPIFVPEMKN